MPHVCLRAVLGRRHRHPFQCAAPSKATMSNPCAPHLASCVTLRSLIPWPPSLLLATRLVPYMAYELVYDIKRVHKPLLFCGTLQQPQSLFLPTNFEGAGGYPRPPEAPSLGIIPVEGSRPKTTLCSLSPRGLTGHFSFLFTSRASPRVGSAEEVSFFSLSITAEEQRGVGSGSHTPRIHTDAHAVVWSLCQVFVAFGCGGLGV